MKKKPAKTVTTQTLNQTKTEVKTQPAVTMGTAKTAVKTEAAKVQEVKNEVKAEEKISEKVNEVASKATEKAATKKATVKKPVVKKTEKEQMVPEVYLQYAGQEANQSDIIAAIKDKYVAEGHRVSAIKSLQVYVKPEENAAYYVINQKVAGMVPLF